MGIVISEADLLSIAPSADTSIVNSLIGPLNEFLPQFDIVTTNRVAMFIGQFAEETDSFRAMHEYASGYEYEGRRDLGNTQPGDGPRFKGRGLAMLTGRSNYELYGRLLGIDLIATPEKAADPAISVHIACLYWQQKGLNQWADRGDVVHCTYLINGGQNGLAVREQFYRKALLVFSSEAPPHTSVPPAAPPTAPGPIAPNPTPPIWQTPEAGAVATSIGGQLIALFTGATGPIAWALAFVVVAALIVGLIFLWKRMHVGH